MMNQTILPRRIYLASSWRNPYQPAVLAALRAAGHEVYDFRNPAPGNEGFSWSEVSRDWLGWTPDEFAVQLRTHPIAAQGFSFDKAALEWCDTCILALPCGRSAHLELGYAAGQGKDTYVLLHEDKFEPELMYLLNTGVSTSIAEIIRWMDKRQPGSVSRWHQESGGHFANPAVHAVRLLREVVELCVAAGGSNEDIAEAVHAELMKALRRGEFGGNPNAVPGEVADCSILLKVFAHYAGIDQLAETRKKLDILWDRQWQANSGGALYRPAQQPEEA